MNPDCADVVVFANIPITLTYAIPDGLTPAPGMRVAVPVRGSIRVGMVIGSSQPQENIEYKPILKVLDKQPLIPADLIEMLLWCSRYYHAAPGACITLAFPPYLRTDKELELTEEQLVKKTAVGYGHLGKKQQQLFDSIPDGGIELSQLKKLIPGATASIKGLLDKGYIELGKYEQNFITEQPPAYMPQQQAAIETLRKQIDSDSYKTFVLRGVTGSGKTEVYLAAAMQALQAGKSVLYMVPEIALTPQSIARIKERIPYETALFHSGLSARKRADEFLRVSTGKARFVLGTRSAIFAPVHDLGLIIVDEEHDGSYKQSDGVAYNARDLSMLRARNMHAVCVLGSATPSMDTISKIEREDVELIQMTERVGNQAMPTIEVVDMRNCDAILSDELKEAIEETTQRGEQCLLFINKRGFSAAMVCPSCGDPLKCKRCDHSLTYHKAKGRAICHFCGFSMALPEICPECSCLDMRPMGSGTERIMEEIGKLYPDLRLLQMDTDEINTPRKLEEALEKIRNKEIDLIVGTQMIAKGHDFPALTMVGVIHAEQMLYMPDFRAIERTFQQIVQVAGRAGRHLDNNRVLIQSLIPDHPVIQAIANYDYDAMIEGEKPVRQLTKFPPYGHMARLIFTAKDAKLADSSAMEAARLGNVPGVNVMGPAPAPMALLKDNHRRQLILTADERGPLHMALGRIRSKKVNSSVRRKIDVDPYDMF